MPETENAATDSQPQGRFRQTTKLGQGKHLSITAKIKLQDWHLANLSDLIISPQGRLLHPTKGQA
jgi:hypothetical protein